MATAIVRFQTEQAKAEFSERFAPSVYPGWSIESYLETDLPAEFGPNCYEFVSDEADRAANICGEICGTICDYISSEMEAASELDAMSSVENY